MRQVRIFARNTVMLLLIAFGSISTANADDIDKLARCIAKSGAKYYAAWWCPYCKKQNELFGKSASRLPYVECSPRGSREVLPKCGHIEGFPTWIFADKSKVRGVQSFQQLASLSGCRASSRR